MEAGTHTAIPGQQSADPHSTNVMRWIAMSIVTAPEGKREIRYINVRRNVEEAIKRFGLHGEEAEERLHSTMETIRNLVRELETMDRAEADAA